MCSWISPVVRGLSPPCKAEDSGSNSGWGTKIPHVTEQLKPAHHNYQAHLPGLESMSCNERSHRMQWRACVLQLRPDAAKYINKCVYIYISKNYTYISKNIYTYIQKRIYIQKHIHTYPKTYTCLYLSQNTCIRIPHLSRCAFPIIC